VKKILVIDDDERIAQALNIRLKLAGYEVLTAADGVYGLGLAMEHKPDLVILDIWMRVGGGFSVAYRLRERAPEVPVIFITASKQAKLREMANNLGAVGFIEKPWQPEELLAAVTLALKGRSPSPVTPEQPPGASVHSPQDGDYRQQLPGPPPMTPGSPARITGRKKVLIVEDDRKIAMALALRLQAAGQDVLLAYDALAGVITARKHRPDLVLLDICLPAGDGFLVAETIQSLLPTVTSIIFLTASRQPGLREKATSLGAAGFLEKPFEVEELIAAIQNALNPQEKSECKMLG
jgi:DNA-binding response OmpR family regulator